ncbi:MAG: AMP-binding protein, partial [Hyphomicrobiales bacterium]|nr:AMP-binding protein [Hyphomicrobiales bacterium]
VMRTGDDAFLMMFTSGTTGPPKGMKLPLRGLAGFAAYMQFGLDVQPDDVFWNIADPGWAYGLFYAVIGPLLIGHQTTLYDGPFTVESTAAVVAEFGITNFAGAPTAYRMIIAEGPEAARPLAENLRVASSAGEPLNPEVMRWFKQHIGCDLFDQYGQTECGMVLANHHGLRHEVRPGSAGYAMPGFRLEVVDDGGNPVPHGTQGILAVHRPGSPLFFFDGYLGAEGEGWTGDYYLTGDTVERNEDGTISFVGRSDDVITSSGYRIGPFDVESCLLEHDAVAESAVVGIPDAERGEIVKAFVVLHSGHAGDETLAEELKQHVRNRLAKHAFPRQVAFVEALPKTPSGKIQRFILRKQ